MRNQTLQPGEVVWLSKDCYYRRDCGHRTATIIDHPCKEVVRVKVVGSEVPITLLRIRVRRKTRKS